MLNRFLNLSIKSKLLFACGISGVMLVMLGGMAFFGMNRLSGQTEFIYKTNVNSLMLLSDLRADLARRSNHVLWHILAQDPATMKEQERKIHDLDQAIERLTEQYEPLIVTESERATYDRLKKSGAEIREARDKVLALSRSFKKEAAADVQRTEMADLLAVLFHAVDGLVEENDKQAKESYAASLSLSATLNWTLFALNLGALLIGAWALRFVSKIIVENLTNVLDAAQQLQQGNLTHRSTVATKDEIGKLAASFNQMADTLQQAAVKQEEALKAQAAELSGMTNAINQAQAVIEFTIDGTVLTANENFLTCMGYTLNEIKGQHHRLFCDPVSVQSQDYATFWKKLSCGEVEAGVYRRLGKGGREVWIRASYSPIKDANGKVSKIVEFSTDITAEQKRQAEFEGLLSAINRQYGMIEFQLDGTILTANDKFLTTTGYTLEELRGRHHRLFCDPGDAASPDYAAFWQKLGRGEAEAGAIGGWARGARKCGCRPPTIRSRTRWAGRSRWCSWRRTSRRRSRRRRSWRPAWPRRGRRWGPWRRGI
jgi:PAS domain S-box-containing protein